MTGSEKKEENFRMIRGLTLSGLSNFAGKRLANELNAEEYDEQGRQIRW